MDLGGDIREDGTTVRSGAAITLLLSQLAVALGTAAFMYMRPLSVARCSESIPCDYALMAASVNGFWIADAAILMLSIVGASILWRRGWWVTVPPLAGIAATIVAVAIANTLALRAVGL